MPSSRPIPTAADIADHARLRAAIDQSPDGVVIADDAGVIVYVNPAYEAQSGYARDELLGRHHTEVAGDLLGPAVHLEMMNAAGRKGAPWVGDVRLRRRDGVACILEMSMSPIRDHDGRMSSFVVVSRDVTRLRDFEADLALEEKIRSALVGALHMLTPDASCEAAAQTICDELSGVPGIDLAAVGVFTNGDEAVLVAARAPTGFPMRPGDALPAHRARRLRDLSTRGAWAEIWASAPEDGVWGEQLDEVGLKAFAYGPIIHGDHVDGGVVLGTLDEGVARTLATKLATVVDFSSVPSAVLAERLHAHRRAIELRGSMALLVEAKAFHTVFQPIVELRTGEIVGHEALTRFENGQPPHRTFDDAWSVGLGRELELATLRRAIEAARQLPAGRWLDINVSPQLLDHPAEIREILWTADRAMVLEITEHEAVADYRAIREAVRGLGQDVRLAVDDAGAGVANFGHIIELGPDFVKLDASLVRRVNSNLGRQALVVGMRHFARTAGCRLVAEGIETAAEARTLTELGVEFGQGHWFGRPSPVDSLPPDRRRRR